MIKITENHKNSIRRAICIFRLRARHQPEPKFKKQWERDIKSLYDVLHLLKCESHGPLFTKLSDEPTYLNP